jgi:integrase
MARKVRHSKLDTRSARLKLPVRKKPFNGPRLQRGALLLYRRNKHNGAWILKCSDGHSRYWTRRIADADDFDTADGQRVLTYFQAQDVAKKLAGGGTDANDTTAPVTVDRALLDYQADLTSRGARAYNAVHPRAHLTALLLSKPVALLGSRELKLWRDSLLGKIAPATINRVSNALSAALGLAAQHDRRIQNRDAWQVGLAVLPDAQTARNVVLPDHTVRRLVAAAYAKDPALGLLVETLAVTGARASQVARLRIEDLHHDRTSKPKLSMPRSGKGGGRNRSAKREGHYSMPVTLQLAKALRAAAAGRAPDAPLLVCGDGSAWGNDPNVKYRRPVREVVAAIGEDPDEVTLYSLRHSSVVRMLLRNIPIRLIAALHNTSVAMIERNYSRHITEHDSDDLSRTGLLADLAPASANVIPLARP